MMHEYLALGGNSFIRVYLSSLGFNNLFVIYYGHSLTNC